LALQLKQIYKSSLAFYIFLGLVGGLSTLAFSPFNIKLIIPFTLAALIYSTLIQEMLLMPASALFHGDLGTGYVVLGG
jgi:predicted membrane metal-binding protein